MRFFARRSSLLWSWPSATIIGSALGVLICTGLDKVFDPEGFEERPPLVIKIGATESAICGPFGAIPYCVPKSVSAFDSDLVDNGYRISDDAINNAASDTISEIEYRKTRDSFDDFLASPHDHSPRLKEQVDLANSIIDLVHKAKDNYTKAKIIEMYLSLAFIYDEQKLKDKNAGKIPAGAWVRPLQDTVRLGGGTCQDFAVLAMHIAARGGVQTDRLYHFSLKGPKGYHAIAGIQNDDGTFYAIRRVEYFLPDKISDTSMTLHLSSYCELTGFTIYGMSSFDSTYYGVVQNNAQSIHKSTPSYWDYFKHYFKRNKPLDEAFKICLSSYIARLTKVQNQTHATL